MFGLGSLGKALAAPGRALADAIGLSGGSGGADLSDPLGSVKDGLVGEGFDYDEKNLNKVHHTRALPTPRNMRATDNAYRDSLGATRAAPTGIAARIGLGGMRAANLQGDAVMSQQQALTGQLQNAAAGRVPSAAERQMQAGLEQNLRSQLAGANSARGGAGASMAAARQSQDVGAQLGLQTAQQASIMRAGEQAQARGMLGQHLGGMRDQSAQRAQMELGAATTQAQLDQQMKLQNQNMILQSRGMDDSRTLGLGGLAQGYNQIVSNHDIARQGMQIDRDLALQGLAIDIEGRRAASDLNQTKALYGMASGGLGIAQGWK